MICSLTLLIEMHCQNFQPDDVTYMSDELGLHRVENTSHSNPAVSLHLYSPPFKSCQVSINIDIN